MRTLRVVTIGFVLSLAIAATSGAQSIQLTSAKATITSCTDGSFVGSAFLVERPSAEGVKVVDIFLSVDHGLTAGAHGVHIHEVGACTPTCAAAGSHLDLGPFGHNVPVTDNHPYHSGDLVNVNVNAQGKGALITSTNRVALTLDSAERVANGRRLSIFDENGSAFVIHALPDAYCPNPADPNCAGGGRAACGIITK